MTKQYKRLKKEEIRALGRFVQSTTIPLSKIAEQQGISLRTLMRHKSRNFYLDPKPQLIFPEIVEVSELDLEKISSRELLIKAKKNIQRTLIANTALAANGSIRKFNPKNLIDSIKSIDSFTSDPRNEDRSVSEITNDLLQDLIFETVMELERKYPSINSRELARTLINENLPKLLQRYNVAI